jgi:hypothetical protein
MLKVYVSAVKVPSGYVETVSVPFFTMIKNGRKGEMFKYKEES